MNTLLLYIPLLALTDRITDRGTNTLASRGLVEPLFQLCFSVSFLFWQEIGFGFTYYYELRVSYSCGVVFSFFGSGGKSFLVLHTYLEYNTVVRLCHFCCCGEKVNFVRIFLFNPNFLLFLVLAGNSFWCYVCT